MRGAGGSPPLARGTVLGGLCGGLLNGITPACAGNRTATLTTPGIARDHPRLRGEQTIKTYFTGGIGGSPPLARGTGDAPAIRQALRRITPACAGNSCKAAGKTRRDEDHPRLRGEQNVKVKFCVKRLGSPPLARGTEIHPPSPCRRFGITPACAGNSLSVHLRYLLA